MGTIDLPKGPHTANSQKSGAKDRRNMPTREELQQTVALIMEEEAVAVLQYLMGKLPEDVLNRLDMGGGLKEKLHGFINRHYQEMFSRYLMSDNAAGEEAAVARHSPDKIAELLRSVGGTGRFNTGEIEKASGNLRDSLEAHTRHLLRQRAGAGAFLREEGAGSVVKCIFRDNARKPGTVTDVKVAVNIPDSALITAPLRRHAASRYLIKSLISRQLMEKIDQELNSAEPDAGNRIMVFLDDGVPADLNPSHAHQGIEHIRSKGFGMAAHMLIMLLDNYKMDYQFIENAADKRELVIREYEDEDIESLPDERYEIRLRYFNQEQLAEACETYDAQIEKFENDIQHLWDMIEVMYQDSKNVFKVNDFEDLAKKNSHRIRDLRNKAPAYEGGESAPEFGGVRAKLARMHERIRNMYEFLYPVERRLTEEQLARLEKEYARIDFLINPHRLQPGLLVDVNITSIKRKRTTLDSMANAMNQFLRNVPECFYADSY